MVCQYHELDRHWCACASVCVCLCVGKWACMHIISASPSIRVVGVGQRCLKYPQALIIQTWVTPLGAALQRLALASTEPDKWNLIPPAMTAPSRLQSRHISDTFRSQLGSCQRQRTFNFS